MSLWSNQLISYASLFDCLLVAKTSYASWFACLLNAKTSYASFLTVYCLLKQAMLAWRVNLNPAEKQSSLHFILSWADKVNNIYISDPHRKKESSQRLTGLNQQTQSKHFSNTTSQHVMKPREPEAALTPKMECAGEPEPEVTIDDGVKPGDCNFPSPLHEAPWSVKRGLWRFFRWLRVRRRLRKRRQQGGGNPAVMVSWSYSLDAKPAQIITCHVMVKKAFRRIRTKPSERICSLNANMLNVSGWGQHLLWLLSFKLVLTGSFDLLSFKGTEEEVGFTNTAGEMLMFVIGPVGLELR